MRIIKIGKNDAVNLLFCFINFKFFEISTLCQPNTNREMAHCRTYIQCLFGYYCKTCAQINTNIKFFNSNSPGGCLESEPLHAIQCVQKHPYFSFENLDLHSNRIPLREYQPASQKQRKYMVIANSVGSHEFQVQYKNE